MAVEDKYTSADVVAGKKAPAFETSTGAEVVTLIGTVAVAAGDDDGSVYRVFQSVPSNYVPIKVEIHNTAVTGGTDYDIGLYKVGVGGAAVDADILADGISMASARTVATSNNAGLTTIGIADGVETLGELSAQTDVDAAYDVALTGNTVGTAAGTIRVTAVFTTK